MNNKLKELAIKCYNPYADFDYEKFADLILEDVVNVMGDSQNYNRCVHTNFDLDRAMCVAAELSYKIKQLYK